MLNKILQFIFPLQCIGCEKAGEYFCDMCCFRIFRPRCQEVRGQNFSKIIYCFSYNDRIVQRLIHTFKFKFVESLGMKLGDILQKAYRRFGVGELGTGELGTGELGAGAFDVGGLCAGRLNVCSVPIHKRRLKERGFNQAAILAKYLTQSCKLRYLDCLERIKYDLPQSKLNRKNRLTHLKGHFSVNLAGEIPKRIILVDDVFTTGSTVNECSRVLRLAGAKEIIVLVLARA